MEVKDLVKEILNLNKAFYEREVKEYLEELPTFEKGVRVMFEFGKETSTLTIKEHNLKARRCRFSTKEFWEGKDEDIAIMLTLNWYLNLGKI